MYETDDPARRLKDVWKGNDSFTIPFDARYGAWIAAALLAPPATVAVWSVTRAFREGGAAGALLLCVCVAAGFAALVVRLRQSIPGRRPYLAAGFAPLVVQMLYPSATAGGPGGALLSIVAAAAVGIGGTILVVRRAGRRIDAVTPLRYQIGVIAAEARAPRPQLEPLTYTVIGPVEID